MTQNTGTATTVFPDENNQPTDVHQRRRGLPGTLVAGTVLTFTLPAGVTFSHAPSVKITAGDMTLRPDLRLRLHTQSCSVTVDTASTALLAIEIYSIDVDVASSVANGGAVTMTLTTTVPVDRHEQHRGVREPRPRGHRRGPQLYIGYNGQNSGLITVTESSAGFFQAGSGGNNQLESASPAATTTSSCSPPGRS